MYSKTFLIDGGAGRVVTSIPALQKYALKNPDENFCIVVGGYESLFYGNKLLSDKTFSTNQKGLFEQIKESEVIKPEPYFQTNYINQRNGLVESFDEIINNTDDHSDLESVHFNLTASEKNTGARVVNEAKNAQQKDKTIVIQPFGSGFQLDEVAQNGYDESVRSISPKTYFQMVKKLSKKYNLVYMGNVQLNEDTYTIKPQVDMRAWISIIATANYFIGCDSLGQHISYNVGTPSSVMLGSTYGINISYPKTHQIIQKKDAPRQYSPIRLLGFDNNVANAVNEGVMDFTESEVNTLLEKIESDIKKRAK